MRSAYALDPLRRFPTNATAQLPVSQRQAPARIDVSSDFRHGFDRTRGNAFENGMMLLRLPGRQVLGKSLKKDDGVR